MQNLFMSKLNVWLVDKWFFIWFLDFFFRHGPAQDGTRKGRHEASSDLRRNPTPVWQEEEDGHSLRPQGHQAQTWQKGKDELISQIMNIYAIDEF